MADVEESSHSQSEEEAGAGDGDMGLALSLDADGDEEDIGLSLDLEGDEEEPEDSEAERRKNAGLNSPKHDGDDEEDLITPRTAAQMRSDAGINSPKQLKTMSFDDDDEEEEAALPSALAGLVTQVQRDDDTGTGFGDAEAHEDSKEAEIEERQATPVVHVPEESLEDEEEAPKGGGLCGCLTSLFSCCSPAATAETTEKGLSTHHKTSGDVEAVAPVTAKTDDEKLLAGESKKTELAPTAAEHVSTDELEEDLESSDDSSTEYPDSLLPPPVAEDSGKKCMVLDLDETLVHSSFRPVPNPDFIVPVEIDGVVHRVYVMKRPYVDEYLVELAKDYEIVIFTASLSKYADPLLDQLDTHKVIRHRLFRESCVLHQSSYVKDLRRLGRKLKDIIIVDNSPASYLFQPKNAVPVASWFDDQRDTQLRDFLQFGRTTLRNIKDVRWILDANHKTYRWLCEQADRPLEQYAPQ